MSRSFYVTCSLLASLALGGVEPQEDVRGTATSGTEVFLMMPLTLVSKQGEIDQEDLNKIWDALATSGADGFMVDVWWGLTELAPRKYSFAAYRQLVDQAKARGFKVQVVSSFHQCGGNVGDTCDIPLPDFVRNASGIWYTDAAGVQTQEYVSLFADDVPVQGRTPLEMYSDWLLAFAAEFADELGESILEVMVGLGPCGEMRYPSYPLDRWNFPGIGEFQCYDPHALESLRAAAAEAGCAACAAPPPAGSYNDRPQDTDFFTHGYSSDGGRFFLDWYSGALKRHATRILELARIALGPKVKLSAKISGIHWWYASPSHAAEVTAGYYNTNGHNAYLEIAEALRGAGADVFDFTCLEMRDSEQPASADSSPESLVKQTIQAAKTAGLAFAGENALQRYDQYAYDQMLSYKEDLHALTYLRITDTLLEPQNLERFRQFVRQMHGAGEERRMAERKLAGDPFEPVGEPMEGLAVRREAPTSSPAVWTRAWWPLLLAIALAGCS